MSEISKIRNLGIAAHIDSGKAQPLSSLVLTPSGWQTMGSLRVGDSVITPSGDQAKITGTYPQGKKDIYTITLHDGGQAECCLDHLWKVRIEGKSKVLSTKQIVEYHKSLPEWKRKYRTNCSVRIPVLTKVSWSEKDLPIDPYLLGLLLGDGSIASTSESLRFFTKDKELERSCDNLLSDWGMELVKYDNDNCHYRIRYKENSRYASRQPKTLKNALKQIELLGTRSGTKFIPKIYKYSSHEQRLSLLQGLMDTDGGVKSIKDRSLVFTTTSKQLSKDVQSLVWSLGGSCSIFSSIDKKNPHWSRKYQLYIRLHSPKEAFRLTRKQNKCYECFANGQQELTRRIVSIKLKGREQAKCIAIDHPEHLYITNDYIATHNTTITERMLFVSGRIRSMGEVHDGRAAMDFDPEEQKRGITIHSAATNFFWNNHQLNLIDTPGHVDFTAEVERSLRVLDGAVLAIDSVAGAQAQSETVNRQMNKYQVPRIAFINKMDRVGANYTAAIDSLGKRLGLSAVAIQIPIGQGAEFRGTIGLVRMVQTNYPPGCDDPNLFEKVEIEPGMLEEAKKARAVMLEAISMHDDELMEVLLNEQQPSEALVKKALRQAVCKGGLVPCMCGAALRNVGIPSLLNAVVDYLPSPVDKGAVPGHNHKTGEVMAFEPNATAPLGAVVFKTIHFATGDLTFVRVYSGTFSAGDQLFNPRLGKTERVGRLFLVHADSKEPVEQASAGKIVACMGLKQAATGDTLCFKENPIAYGATTFAKPVISMAIEPTSSGDRDKLGEILGIVVREDPTFRANTDEETGETIISGMGELHLEVVAHRIENEFGIKVSTGKPRVAYRQTFSRSGTIESRHIKQSGGSGQFAVAVLDFEPIEGDEVELIDKITQGKITKEFVRALFDGVRDTLLSGGRRGAQIQGVRVIVHDGKMHDVDSNSNAFYSCGCLAARLAEEQLRLILLEPIMRVDVSVPDAYLGSVLGDLNARRGLIHDVGSEGQDKVITAFIPLAELSAYSTTLRSVTSGRGNYTMSPMGYKSVPNSILEKMDAAKEVKAKK